MDKEHDLYLLLGRLEGKLDAVAAMLGTANNRLDTLETRVNATEHDVNTIKSVTNHNRQWLATALSLTALGISAAGIYFGG